MANEPIKLSIQSTLARFANGKLADNARDLFNVLGYRSDKTVRLASTSPQAFIAQFKGSKPLNEKNVMVAEWTSAELVFQLTSAEVAHTGQRTLFESDRRVDDKIIESYVFLAIGLRSEIYSRTQLAAITREVNRIFPMPALILFQHGTTLTLAVIDRRLHKRDESKDVLEKVTLIKDIRTASPHRAHIEILFDLSLDQLRANFTIANWIDLHNAWRETLDTSELNKRFFREVAYWYYWAQSKVKFPKGAGKNDAERSAISVIRLLTRLIFVWFVKEKNLVPDDLFDQPQVDDLLKYDDPKDSTYYKAILQNLFFGTLNTESGNTRGFRHQPGQSGGRSDDYMAHNRYRYRKYFKKPDEFLKLCAPVPFLNGGLFECLDKSEDERVDGFSDRPDNELVVPDELFFGKERDVDLNDIFGTSNKRYKVRGLIHIFDNYKFTVDENTPIEEEIALDPELLGKVFENLLAAYNPETGVTARKQTGSFYTPREIVNYMVDESLLAYMLTTVGTLHSADVETLHATSLPPATTPPPAPVPLSATPPSPATVPPSTSVPPSAPPPPSGPTLRKLLAYNDEPHGFSGDEVARLIAAIDNLKALDPACGSGAFPMGLLHKLVYVLRKIDPDNARWKALQIARAQGIADPKEHASAVADIEDAFANDADYARKLYIIENCLYGVDIQPIAVQIAKLRCFISLIVDDRVDDAKPNRGIRPLPNLETKFVAANSLIGIERPRTLEKPQEQVKLTPKMEKLRDELVDILRQYLKVKNPATQKTWLAKGEAAAEELNRAFKDVPGFTPINANWVFTTARSAEDLVDKLPGAKQASATPVMLRSSDIDEKEKQLAEVRRRHFAARTTDTKNRWRAKDKQLRAEIADLLKKGGWADDTAKTLAAWDPYDQNTAAEFFDPEWMFDVQDGFDIVISNPPYVRQEQISEFKPLFQKQYTCYTGTADLYVYFYERGFQVLKQDGVLTYISSNKYFRSGYGEKLRAYLGNQTTIHQLIDFGDAPIFTAIAYPSIIVASKRIPVDVHETKALTWKQGEPIEQFDNVVRTNSFLIAQKELTSDGWRLEAPTVLRLLEKLRGVGKPLSEYVKGEIYRGVITGLNEAYVVDRETRDRLIREDASSAKVLKSFLRGRNVKRWHIRNDNEYLIKIESSENAQHPWSGKTEKEAERIFAKTYPAILAWLNQFRDALTKRDDQGKYFWELRSCAYWHAFTKQKIIYPDIYEHQSFTVDTDGYYSGNTTYFIPTDEKWLCGLFNSSVIEWFYSQISNKVRGGYLRAFTDYMNQIPIPDATQQQQSYINRLVDRILAAKRQDPETDTSALEREIDQLVYQLYGLTDGEIKVVEGK